MFDSLIGLHVNQRSMSLTLLNISYRPLWTTSACDH